MKTLTQGIMSIYTSCLIIILSQIPSTLSLVISIPENDEVIFLNGNVNQYYNTTLFLPSCSSQNPLQSKTIPTFSLKLSPLDIIPVFTLYINKGNDDKSLLKPFYLLEQITELHYQLTIQNLCDQSSSIIPNDTSVFAISDTEHTRESTETEKTIRMSFEYNQKKYSFNYITLCSAWKTTHVAVSFLILALISGMIIFIVVTLQVDFELIAKLHRNTEIHWWFGPAAAVILSAGIMFAYYTRIGFWIVNILFIVITSVSCMHVFKWEMNNLIQLETSSTCILSIQLFFMKEVCCKMTVLTIFSTIFVKVIFVLWVATRSIFLGNMMIFCFIFCMISGANVKNFKSIVLLLVSFALYEILWSFLSNRFYDCNLNLLMSQNLEAPSGIHLKAFDCWSTIYAAEILFPAVTLKYCYNFDHYSKKKYFIWGFVMFYIAMAVSFIIDYTQYVLLISTVSLIGGLLGKAAFDKMFSQFWNGNMSPFSEEERESLSSKSSSAKENILLQDITDR